MVRDDDVGVPPGGQRPSTRSRQGGKVLVTATAASREKRPATARFRSNGNVSDEEHRLERQRERG